MAVSAVSLKNLTPWRKGQSGNPGGGPSKLLKRIDEMCAADGKHPYTELMALIPQLSPTAQADVWLQLLAYCQAKPKQTEAEETATEIVKQDLAKLSMNELLTLVKENLPEEIK